jgi:dUTP pyrophosphatase
MKVQVKRLTPTAVIPAYQSEGAAGFDFHADLGKDPAVLINPGQTVLVATGLAFAVPKGYEMQVRARSSMALKKGLTVQNSPGTVDSDYRGEVHVMLHNNSGKLQMVNHGDRIGQGLIKEVPPVEFEEVDTLDETARGSGGYGSTGQ